MKMKTKVMVFVVIVIAGLSVALGAEKTAKAKDKSIKS